MDFGAEMILAKGLCGRRGLLEGAFQAQRRGFGALPAAVTRSFDAETERVRFGEKHPGPYLRASAAKQAHQGCRPGEPDGPVPTQNSVMNAR